jgi:acetyl-CoA carboxylase carboxyl transferase subunit beta
MPWFKRSTSNITTKIRKDIPDGVWIKVPTSGETVHRRELVSNFWVDPNSGYHFRVGSAEYFEYIFDKPPKRLGENIRSVDELEFVDRKAYKDRLVEAEKTSGLTDAINVGKGKVDGLDMVVACMDFAFIGGSMGSVVGERISLAIDEARKSKLPLVILSQSGGARMMESVLSLMQLAKITSKLALFHEEGGLYISYMTNPTTGGVTASYAMLGDVNIAEPGALIGFAGPRVIRQTIGRDLPEGFQTSEYLLEHGFLDFIVKRPSIKQKLAQVARLLAPKATT